MNDRQDRIAKLSQRFKTHRPAKLTQESKERERRSFYLDVALMDRLNKEYKAFNHRIYPSTVSKSVFLETLLEYGLEHLDAVEVRLPALTSEDEQG